VDMFTYTDKTPWYT